MKSIVKLIIQLFANLIKNNKEALKFLYTKALKKKPKHILIMVMAKPIRILKNRRKLPRNIVLRMI